MRAKNQTDALPLRAHLGGIIVDQRAGHRARRESVGAGLGNGGDLGAGAGDETFLEPESSSGMMRRSITLMPRRFARSNMCAP